MGHAKINNLYAKPSNLRRHIDWTENQTYEFGMDAKKDNKHNQKHEGKIVRCFLKEFLIGREIAEDSDGLNINEEGGSFESIRPVVDETCDQARKVRLVSTRWRCFLSAMSFWALVCR